MAIRFLIRCLSRHATSNPFKNSSISLLTTRNFSHSPQHRNRNLNSLFNPFSQFPQKFPLKFIQIEQFSSKSDPHCTQNVLEKSEMIKEMEITGFRGETVAKKTDHLICFGFNMDEINRILCSFPGYVSLNHETRLRPLFQELHQMGFAKHEIKQVIFGNPKLFLTMEAGELSRYVKLLESLKCRQPIKNKILLNGYLSAAMNVKLKIECLYKHGLTRRDAFKVLYVEPRVILYNLEDVEKKIEFLLHKMKFCMEHIVECPEYLGVNLVKQIIPRYSVLEHLKSIGGLGDEIWMKHYVQLSRAKFFNLFVKPYPECIRIFEVKRVNEVRPRFPVGMWKLFRPEKFRESRKDVRNMKEFMGSRGKFGD